MSKSTKGATPEAGPPRSFDRSEASSPSVLILDVRPREAFEQMHHRGTVNIPLEELARRIHELPPRSTLLSVFDTDARRARWARSRLRARGRPVGELLFGEQWLASGPTESGPSKDRLWQPHALLIEAVELARRHWSCLAGRKALDVACGTGRDAAYLALSGFDVEAWDVLPDALALCRELAGRNGVCVSAQLRDVERDPSITTGRYDLICCFNFLHRPLMNAIRDGLRTGGFVAYETFVHPQRERFGKPRREARELRPGELSTWFEGWEVITSREGLAGPRRIAASLIARKP